MEEDVVRALCLHAALLRPKDQIDPMVEVLGRGERRERREKREREREREREGERWYVSAEEGGLSLSSLTEEEENGTPAATTHTHTAPPTHLGNTIALECSAREANKRMRGAVRPRRERNRRNLRPILTLP